MTNSGLIVPLSYSKLLLVGCFERSDSIVNFANRFFQRLPSLSVLHRLIEFQPLFTKSQEMIKKVFKDPIEFVWRSLTLKYLIKKQHEIAPKRSSNFAVFANDTVGLYINIDGVFEKDQLDLLMEFLKSRNLDFTNKICIDIGANIGNHTVYWANIFSSVIAFEAHPIVFKLLQFNTQSHKNVSVFNVGIGKKKETLRLSANDHNTGGSSFVYDQKQKSYYDVAIEKLDHLLNTAKNIGLIKIDVEGMEEAVIKGARSIIDRHKPIIIFEQSKEEFDGKGMTKSINLLSDLGYEFFWIEDDWSQKSKLQRIIKLISGFVTQHFHQTWSIIGDKDIPIRHHDMLIAISKNA